jgi:molecular chaperone DnaK (HSP70)
VGLVVGVIGRYSYRAMQRMKEEMDDYQYALQEYERQQLKKDSSSTSNSSSQNSLRIATVAIDFGTSFCKIATTFPTLEVVVSRQGDRSVFNGIVYDESTGDSVALGRAALEQYYYDLNVETKNGSAVVLPYQALAAQLQGTTATTGTTAFTTTKIVSDVLSPRLQDVLEKTELTSPHSTMGIRPVVTVPSQGLANLDVYRQAFPDAACYIPEPVAAVWGAQFYNLLETTQTPISKPSMLPQYYLVIDVGGWTTQIAIVSGNIILHNNGAGVTTTLPLGGEHFIASLVAVLNQESKLSDARSLALLQFHARQAVAELATQTRVALHVPYLFADPAMHHLETSIARSILDQATQEYIREEVVPELLSTNKDALSPHFATPLDLQSLWMSALTQVLERASLLPTSIHGVLLVGGGAKTVLVHQSLSSAWNTLTGGLPNAAPIVRPDSSLQSELTVMGAATLPPSFDYSVVNGLVQR